MNYLEGEQRICDVWARYINSKNMTMEEAADFIRISHVLPNASAHLIYTDTKKGVSTRTRLGTDDYEVSYVNMDFMNDISWISDIGESINISHAYTNPMNGEQSIAFCNKITLKDPAAGEYMRPALVTLTDLIDKGCINLEECDKISDNYTEVILRFFEGDVPMMICTGDTVSGTGKRESQSQAFTDHPFSYSFTIVPTTDKGGYFIDTPSVQFSVNNACSNLDMTNEFMCFLITNTELNRMASIKRLITPAKDFSFDKVYAPIGNVSSDLIVLPTALGIEDTLAVQIRVASFKVATKELTIDEAVAQYGSLK